MQRKKVIAFLFIFILVLALAGCASPSQDNSLKTASSLPASGGAANPAPQDLNPDLIRPDEIRQQALEAIGTIRTYSFEMTLDLNLGGQNQKSVDQHTEISGSIDKTNKKLHITMTLNQQIGNQRSGGTVSSAEIYVDNENMYVRSGSAGATRAWRQQPASTEIWDEQDIISQQRKLLESSEIRVNGTDRVNDKLCYVLELEPDTAALWETLKQRLSADQVPEGVDLKEMLRNISLKIWVMRDTWLPLRVQEMLTLIVPPEESGKANTPGETTMKVKFDLSAFDYNCTMSLDPPDGIK